MFNQVFTQDVFGLTAMTAAINNLPYVPQQLSRSGLFQEEGIATLDAFIEFNNGVVSVLPIKARGAPGTPVLADKRKAYSFRVPHIPQTGAVLADQVQGRREFGTENQTKTVERERDKVLLKMRTQMDLTMEAHRIQAIQGKFYDVNGTLNSLYTMFGVSEQTVAMALPTATTKVRQKILTAQTMMEDALGGLAFSGIDGWCGANFWSELIEHPLVKETYLGYQAAAERRGDPRDDFVFGGVTWRRYRGSSAVQMPTDEARLVPTGVQEGEFALTRFAPANYMEAVNTTGLPYYAKSERMPMDKGMDMEAQSNPLNIVTRPAALIKLTKV